MTNCSACKKSLKTSDKVICSRTPCARQYHFACVNLTSEYHKKLQVWVCPLCTSKQPKSGDNSDTPVKLTLTIPTEDTGCANITVRRGTPSPTSPHDGADIPHAPPAETIVSEALNRDVAKAITDAMAVQFRVLGERITGLETSVNFVSGQCDDMLKLYSDTKASIANLCDENKELREELNAVKARVKALEDAQARNEQWARAQNIEVVGVPEVRDESPVGVIVRIAAEVGISVQSSDIEFAHRVQARRPPSSAAGGASAGLSRAIVVRFRQRATKDTVVAAARKHRHITSKDIGIGGETRKIYVNEHLTRDNKQLLKQCKLKAAESNYKHVWTKNCRIYIRKTDTSPPIPIISALDLEKI